MTSTVLPFLKGGHFNCNMAALLNFALQLVFFTDGFKIKLCVYLTKLWISSVQRADFTPKFPLPVHHCTVLQFYDPGGRRDYRPNDGFTRDSVSCRHWRWSWVGQKAGLQVSEKRQISFLAGKWTVPTSLPLFTAIGRTSLHASPLLSCSFEVF